MVSFHKLEQVGKPDIYRISSWESRYPYVNAGISGRHGGVSLEDYHSLNCGLHVNDLSKNVIENRKRLASAAQFNFDRWTFAEQVHSNRVAVVSHDNKGAGCVSMSTALPSTDALITNESGICLAGVFADCVPIYFLDPEHKAVGLAHAGWKGTVSEIAKRSIESMADVYDSQPNEIQAVIGPSIGPCCYEVDEKVISLVNDLLFNLPSDMPVYIEKDHGKFMLDLQQLNRQIMIKAGVLPVHIELCNICTSCHTDFFYSYRKEGVGTGRMAAWIGMNN